MLHEYGAEEEEKHLNETDFSFSAERKLFFLGTLDIQTRL